MDENNFKNEVSVSIISSIKVNKKVNGNGIDFNYQLSLIQKCIGALNKIVE